MFKLYSIISSPTASADEKNSVVNSIMKISSSLYPTKLSSPRQIRANTYYPERIATSSFATSSFTGFGLYKLTDAEASLIRTDPLISKVQLISTASRETDDEWLPSWPTASFEDIDGVDLLELIPRVYPSGYTLEEELQLNSSQPDRNFRPYGYTQHVGTYMHLSQSGDISNFSTWFHSLPSDKMYSGSFGKETSRMIGNNPDSEAYAGWSGLSQGEGNVVDRDATYQPGGIGRYTNFHDHDYSIDGENVDFVEWEWAKAIEWNHAEFYGRDGNTRVKFVDWSQYGMEFASSSEKDIYFQKIYASRITNASKAFPIPHQQQCAMAACGLTGGFAKGANIHMISAPENPNIGDHGNIIQTLNTLKQWDATKPINPKTGRRNRTVVNVSFVPTHWTNPPYQHLSPSKNQQISGSVEITNTHEFPGIRFEMLQLSGSEFGPNSGYRRRDYIFCVSASNGKVIEGSVNKVARKMNIYYTSSFGSLGTGIAADMNSRLNPRGDSRGWSVSISQDHIAGTKHLHFTSSNRVFERYARYMPIRIYTGSIYDFAHHDISPEYSPNSPRGGTLVYEEPPETSAKTNISKVVVKGNLVYTGSTDSKMGSTGRSNGYVNANSGHLNSGLAPADQYGIDRGYNGATLFLPLAGMSKTPIGSEYLPTIDQALQECAEQGIVICCAAMNDAHQKTMASSSIEDNPLYDPDLYSDELWNTYIEYDREISGWSIIYGRNPFDGSPIQKVYEFPEGPIPANSPIRVGNPGWGNNYSTIQVGAMSLWEYHDSQRNNPFVLRMLSGSVYGGRFPNNITKDRIQTKTNFCHGKAISVYAVDGHQTIGGTSASFADLAQSGTTPSSLGSSVIGFIASSSTFYDRITFNTSSLAALYDESYLQPALSSSLTSSLGGEPKVPKFTQGLYTIDRSGGTSFSSPLVAGMVCCYLQVNPDASFVDVRNWLHNTGMKEIPGTSLDPNKYLVSGRYTTSSMHPAYYNDLFMDSGSIDYGGRNPIVARFPYTSPFRGRLSNITMGRS